jgi:uncharacterized protein YkwD
MEVIAHGSQGTSRTRTTRRPFHDLHTNALACGYGKVVGENIGFGYASPRAVVAGWLASPGHRANIVNHASRRPVSG